MILYLDASALVKRYLEEPGADAVRALLDDALLATARFSEPEVASALSRRCREGSFPRAERDRALEALRQDFGVLFLVETTAEVVERSRDLVVRHPLRAADSLQLAACLELRDRLALPVRFVACDERLLKAARDEGLETGP